MLSSRIEGTQSSLSEHLRHEIDGVPSVPIDDVTEVSCRVAAMQHGLARHGILHEITGGSYGKTYAYSACLDLLNEGNDQRGATFPSHTAK